MEIVNLAGYEISSQIKVAQPSFCARSCWCDSARAQGLQKQTCRRYSDHVICSMSAISVLYLFHNWTQCFSQTLILSSCKIILYNYCLHDYWQIQCHKKCKMAFNISLEKNKAIYRSLTNPTDHLQTLLRSFREQRLYVPYDMKFSDTFTSRFWGVHIVQDFNSGISRAFCVVIFFKICIFKLLKNILGLSKPILSKVQ